MTLTESAAPVSQQVKGPNPVQAWIFSGFLSGTA